MINRIIVTFILLAGLLCAQVEHSQNINPYSIAPEFYLDLANFKSEIEGKTRVDVFLKVPYSNIQFVKKNNGYQAEYSVTLTFFDEDKENIMFENLWSEKVFVPDFNQTVSKSSFNISYRNSDLRPGTYNLQCIIEDNNSRKTVKLEGVANIKTFKDPIELSDMVLISEKIKDEKGESIIPSVSNIITTRDNRIDFFYEIYADKAENVIVDYSILDKEENVIFTEPVSLELSEGTNVVNHSFSNRHFSLGDYNIILRLKNDDGDILNKRNKVFHSKIYGFPSSITDLDVAVKQMVYIAPSNVIEELDDIKDYDEKLSKYREYWKSKDPSPNTEENEVLVEYYRRVAYANTHFESYREGWRTDMGMIYITLGAPDQVDRHPFEYNAKPYEVWDYFDINRRFIFVDQTGFGDYRLLNQSFGDWYRYRY